MDLACEGPNGIGVKMDGLPDMAVVLSDEIERLCAKEVYLYHNRRLGDSRLAR